MTAERYYDIKLPADSGALNDEDKPRVRFQRIEKRRFSVYSGLKAASLVGAAVLLTLFVSKWFGLIKEVSSPS